MRSDSSNLDDFLNAKIWKNIICALIINALLVPTVIGVLFWGNLLNSSPSDIMSQLQNTYYKPYFMSLHEFFNYFSSKLIAIILLEEILYRGPIRIIVAFTFLFKARNNKLVYGLIWALGIFLNYKWAIGHIAQELIWIPIFMAGLVWLWIVIKTNRLWPSVVCHSIANISIFFLLKIHSAL